MSLVLTIKEGEGFQIDDIVIVQLKDFRGKKCRVLIDTDGFRKVARLKNKRVKSE